MVDKKPKTTYSFMQQVSSMFMILALIWLTISIPFVFSYQQKLAAEKQLSADVSALTNNSEEDSTNPFGNNTEERSANGANSFSEEYLHDHHTTDHFFSFISQYYKCENAGTYIAFHGELLVPPPNKA